MSGFDYLISMLAPFNDLNMSGVDPDSGFISEREKKDLLKRSSSQKDKSQSSQIVTKLRRFEESYCAAALSAASSVSLLSFHLSFFSNSIWCKYIFIHFDFSLPSGEQSCSLSLKKLFWWYAFSAFSRWSFYVVKFKSRWHFIFFAL